MGVRFPHEVPKIMSIKKYVLYLDSLANIHSQNKIEGSCLEVFGVEQEEWDTWTNAEKEEHAREIAFNTMLEWGWYEE
jgi:hypothetical protein